MKRLAVHAGSALDMLAAVAPSVRALLQLEAGNFTGGAQIELGEQHQLAVAWTSRALALHGAVGEDAMLCFALRANRDRARLGGQSLAGATLVLLGPGTALDLQLPADCRFAFLQLSSRLFAAACDALALRSCRALALGAGAHAVSGATLAGAPGASRAWRRSARWAEIDGGGWRLGLRTAVLASWLEANWAGIARIPVSSGRQQLLARAIDELRQARAEPLDMPALAQLCGGSQRSLEYAFQASYGVSPHRFDKLSRLGAARSQLRACPELGVSAIARGLHFGHLGKFAYDYAQLFGERPSETLRGPRGTARLEQDEGRARESRQLWHAALRLVDLHRNEAPHFAIQIAN